MKASKYENFTLKAGSPLFSRINANISTGLFAKEAYAQEAIDIAQKHGR
jgi:hypothetical protein